MKAAASLAEAIADTFGFHPQLVEAHDGLFEINLDGGIVFTNQSSCNRVPTIPEALEAIGRHLEPLPGKGHRTTNAFPMNRS